MARCCRSVIFGAENFESQVLMGLRKGQSRESILAASQVAHDAGLQVRLEFITGLPEETPDSVVRNLNFAYNALRQGWVDQVVPYVLCPHPGTAYGEFPEQHGLVIVHRDYTQYIEEGGYPAFYTRHLSREQIYTYYLLLRQIDSMALGARRMVQAAGQPMPAADYSATLWQRFFTQVGGRNQA